MQNSLKVVYLVVGFMLATVFQSVVDAQQTTTDPFVRPIVGSRMVVGDDEVQDYTTKCFLHLCQKPLPKVVLIQLDDSSRMTEAALQKHGAGFVLVLKTITADAEKLTRQMLDANGVWIEGDPAAIAKHPLMLALLRNINERNGVIAVVSSSVSLLSELDENDKNQRIQSPFAICQFHFGNKSAGATSDDLDSHLKVHWSIPDSAALVIHRGRRVAGYGREDISVVVEGANGWPERTGTFECPDVFSSGSYPFHGLDLLSWVRSANERGRAVFPPKEVSIPAIEKGALFLHGGSGVSEDVMQEFVKLAGGKEASIVCIPSAQRFEWSEAPRSYSAQLLRDLGLTNVAVLHADDPVRADQNEELAELIKKADGVWIDGGRTFRFMDCYEGTRVQKLIAEVLDRGGVVGGSSAGCQVPGDFLVRGNPKTNRDMAFGGYTRGMGLLKGVVIDAHFLQRQRHEPFLELMKNHPQLLGIGIDEQTALVVKGQVGKVLGEAAVSFYDLNAKSDAEFQPVILKSGESYDLKTRKKQN